VGVAAFVLGGGAASWILSNGYVPNQLYSLQSQLDACRSQNATNSRQSTLGGKADDAVSDEWAPLTKEQIAEWGAKLAAAAPRSITVYWSQEVDARRFFRSLQAVGKQLHCEVKAGLGQADGAEISISTNKNDPSGPIMLKLFKSLNWPTSLDQNDNAQGMLIFIPQKLP
jgi:hypothetical protein